MSLIKRSYWRASRAANAAVRHFRLAPIAKQVLAKRLTYLSKDKLYSMTTHMERLNQQGVDGDVYEFGIALGGSSIVMAGMMGNRCYHGYDVFGMIPPPSEQDEVDSHDRYAAIEAGESQGIDGDEYYGYQKNLYEVVIDNFKNFGLTVDGEKICLHKGLFSDTLSLTDQDRIVLAHIDCDWYEPVKFCLEKIADHLVTDGVIIIDDYNDYAGCRKATDEFLDRDGRFRLAGERPHAVLMKT